MGRLTEKAVTIDGTAYWFSYTYDAAGNLTRIVYPGVFGDGRVWGRISDYKLPFEVLVKQKRAS